jgi:hypothetical protein
LPLHLPCAIENAACHIGGHAAAVAKLLGEFEYELIGGFGRSVKRLLRAVALLLRNLFLVGRRLLRLYGPVALLLRDFFCSVAVFSACTAITRCSTAIPRCQ